MKKNQNKTVKSGGYGRRKFISTAVDFFSMRSSQTVKVQQVWYAVLCI